MPKRLAMPRTPSPVFNGGRSALPRAIGAGDERIEAVYATVDVKAHQAAV
jgi:hypothetical protein